MDQVGDKGPLLRWFFPACPAFVDDALVLPVCPFSSELGEASGWLLEAEQVFHRAANPPIPAAKPKVPKQHHRPIGGLVLGLVRIVGVAPVSLGCLAGEDAFDHR